MKYQTLTYCFLMVLLFAGNVYGYENLSLRADVSTTASGFTQDAENPDKVRDNNKETKWCDNKQQDKFLLFDLGALCKIDKITLFWEDWDRTPRYRIMVSENSIDWKEVVNEMNNNTNPSEYVLKLKNIRYIMFLTLKNDDDAVRLMEFQIWGESSASKEAGIALVLDNLSKMPDAESTASGFTGPLESPTKAIDGNPNTKWCDNSSKTKWLQLDLYALCNIKELILDWENWDINSLYTIQTSTDGVNWATQIEEISNTTDRRRYRVNWENIRFLKFIVPEEAHDDAVRLMEFEVYGKVINKIDKSLFEKKEALVHPNLLRDEGKKKIYDLARFVDTKVGVVDGSGSNCVIGPQLPFASINPSPQTPNGEHDGYKFGEPIRGFGQLHVSGTGWGKYGHFLLSPQIGLKVEETEHDSPASEQITRPNYYKANLDRYSIVAEIAPTTHAAIYRLSYPKSNEANILMDVTHSLTRDIVPYVGGMVRKNEIHIDKTFKDKMWGLIEYEGGFGNGYYMLYFYAQTNKRPKQAGVWKNGDIQPEKYDEVLNSANDRIGGFFSFDTKEGETVYYKIAISFHSIDKAKEYLTKEIPDWDFEKIKSDGEDVWNQTLSSIFIPEATEKQMKMFYSAMYHAHTMPRDRTKDFKKFDGDTLWDDHFAIWDTWRTLFPLYSIIRPELIASNINSFINRFNRNGRVKDAFIAGIDMEQEQGGNNIDNIIADAIIKELCGFDHQKAYEILKHNAEKERKAFPLISTDSLLSQNDSNAYRQLGYVPAGIMSSSISMEYYYNDFVVALAAQKLGKDEDYKRFLNRSLQWTKLWNPDITDNGFKGFISSRTKGGEWVDDMDVTKNWGSWRKYFYEGNAWTYSFFVPHDFDRLIELSGGKENFTKKLNYAFENNLIDIANEPSFLSIRSFSNAGRTDLTCYWVDYVLKNYYDEYSVPGNDDSGAMSSWYIFSSLGFFPNAGQNTYYLNAPLYKKAIIQRAEGDVIINNPNFGDKNIYLKSVSINGKKLKSSRFDFQEIKNGAVIDFETTNKKIIW